MRILCYFFLSCILFSSAEAQDYYRWIQFAEEAEKDGDLLGAVHYYETAYDLDSTKQDLQYALAESYEKAGLYNEAERLFLKVYNKGRGRFYPEGPSHIAQIKMYQGKYESAIEFWRRAIRRTDSSYKRSIFEEKLKSCSYALSNPLSNEDIELFPLTDINTSDSEIGIDWSGDSLLLFSSLRGEYNDQLELESAEYYFARIYTSQVDKYGMGASEVLKIEGVDPANHILYPAFTKDGQSLFFSLCDDLNRCNLAYALKNDNGFELKSILEENYSNGVNNSQPFHFSSNSTEYILFSSSREGGFGGYDIWIAEFKNGELVNSTNLGPKVNTAGNEVTPYFDIHESRLYFSSDLLPGYGDYDIFTIGYKPYQNLVEKPMNLGKPINSSVKDIYYRKYGANEYLSTNRSMSITDNSSYCCTDIFQLRQRAIDSTQLFDIAVVPESIKSVDELQGLLPLSLYFHNDIPDPGSLSSSTDIDYAQTLEDYLDLRETYLDHYTENIDDSTKISSRVKMNLFFDEEVLSQFQNLEGVSRLLLGELEKGRSIEIAIKGYASPLAQSDYNRKLTQRRINSIVNY
ncbi:MAG: tetratricopeptide repeat protein, partial [Flavobacteriales bacterium]|nr:tetratricopeptide repeat protein [Flavobacteriales bacterium]